jgi:hypothetical protein
MKNFKLFDIRSENGFTPIAWLGETSDGRDLWIGQEDEQMPEESPEDYARMILTACNFHEELLEKVGLFCELLDAWAPARKSEPNSFDESIIRARDGLRCLIQEIKTHGTRLVKPKKEPEYEVLLEPDAEDSVVLRGWFPIHVEAIRHPERISKYVANGILRKRGTKGV